MAMSISLTFAISAREATTRMARMLASSYQRTLAIRSSRMTTLKRKQALMPPSQVNGLLHTLTDVRLLILITPSVSCVRTSTTVLLIIYTILTTENSPLMSSKTPRQSLQPPQRTSFVSIYLTWQMSTRRSIMRYTTRLML